ncbi:proton-translocating NADH-quinone oxidoreductase, chain M family protein [Mycobacterium xenopi 3993]|nr:proton-translocating NADH-quinone oxidoreductase, chain M family protein [Mycobacterium xenopi 3993]
MRHWSPRRSWRCSYGDGDPFPWLSVLWLVPLVGAGLVIVMPPGWRQAAKWLGLIIAVAVLGIALVITTEFDTGGAPYQFVEKQPWIPAFGAGYTLGVDGIAVVLVLLTAVLVPLLMLAGWNEGGQRSRGVHAYVALTLTVESMVLISLISLDVLLFYVFFEAMLIPMYFLIGGFGHGAGRSRAAVKFLLYNLFGGLIMLAAVIGVYVVTAQHIGGTFDFRTIVAAVSSGRLGVDPAVLKALFLGFMFAFAIKAPLWPFHRWLPDAAVEAPPATAVLMMAVMDKVGTFGMLRYCLQLFPDASTYFRPLIVVLSVIGVVYGAIVAIGQTDIMRLIAYTSISHFGFIILGIFVMTTQGQSGSTLYMVNHGLSTAAVFLIAGFLIARGGTRSIADYGGVQKVAPVLAGTFLVAALATLSLPGLAPFISEFLVLLGTFNRYWVAAAFASTALVLSAVYMLWLYQRVMNGPVAQGNDRIRDLVPREVVVVAPLIALLLGLGVYPKPVLDIINPRSATPWPPSASMIPRQGFRSRRCVTTKQPKDRTDEHAHAQCRVLRAFPDAHRLRGRDRRCGGRGIPAATLPICQPGASGAGQFGCRIRRGRAGGQKDSLFGSDRSAASGGRRPSGLGIAGHRAAGRDIGHPVHRGAQRRNQHPDRARRCHGRAAYRLDFFAPQASAVPDSVAERQAIQAGYTQTEVFPLTMLAVGGMLVFPAANDLLTMFVALEVLSLPLYLLCGLARRRRLLSQEAAVKYFLLGAFSSAFFLYGVALLYGATGTLTLAGIRDGLTQHRDDSIALIGVALLAVGLLFKVGAVPFHSWIPDVYQGAPTPITGFMAAATKVAAFGALMRVVYVALPPLHDQWRPVLWASRS